VSGEAAGDVLYRELARRPSLVVRWVACADADADTDAARSELS
jgi:hypothetical protein